MLTTFAIFNAVLVVAGAVFAAVTVARVVRAVWTMPLADDEE